MRGRLCGKRFHRCFVPTFVPTQAPPASTRHPVPDWRPLVTVNAAVSLDGRIAGRHGRTLVLSDAQDLQRVHAMRAEHDAILVGIGTVLADDPALVIKRDLYADGEDPIRVVLDSSHRMPMTARVASGDPPTILFCTHEGVEEATTLNSVHGVDVVGCPADERGRVNLACALKELRRRGIRSLMVEGGSNVIASFVGAGFVDRLSLFVAPVVVGEGAPALVAQHSSDAGSWWAGFEVMSADSRTAGITVHLAPRESPA